MNINLNLKILGSWLLIFVPVILLITQQLTGIFPFREETADSVVFVFIVMFCIAIGYGLQGSNAQYKVLFFLIAFGVMNIIPLFINLNIGTWDFIGFEEFFEYFGISFGILLPYWFMGSPIGFYPFTGYQMLCLAIPLSIFAISAIKITATSRDHQNLTSGIVELILMAVILVIACLYGFLGLSYYLL